MEDLKSRTSDFRGKNLKDLLLNFATAARREPEADFGDRASYLANKITDIFNEYDRYIQEIGKDSEVIAKLQKENTDLAVSLRKETEVSESLTEGNKKLLKDLDDAEDANKYLKENYDNVRYEINHVNAKRSEDLSNALAIISELTRKLV